MTVYNKLNKIAYIGSAEQTLYPIPFEYISTDDIKVSVYTLNNEFVEDWTYSIQYVIEGGNVKVLSGYNIDNTNKLLILRSVDLIQDNKYREGGDFPAKSTETSFDKLTMITQQLQEALDRCVKVDVLDIQTPEELLQAVYDKLDSATEIAGDAISAANQAQTAADNATAAVNSAEQTLVQTQAYVTSAKVEIDNTKNTAINTINSTVSTAKGDIANTVVSAKADINTAVNEATTDISDTSTAAINTINTAVSNAESNISTIVSNAEGSIANIAVTEANKAIANAAQEATDTATANVNSYINGTVKPSLQTYVDQAQEEANSAATSMEQAALSATAANNYASNASADADNAAESAGLAANSAAAASASETNAKNWAIKMDGLVDGEDYSAKYYADQARKASAGAVTDGKSITRNSDDELQTIGVINQNDTTKAIKSWSGTKAQYDALPTKDADTLYNITDDSDAQTYEAYTKSETDALVNAKQDKITGVSGVGDYVVEWKAPTSSDPSWYRKYKSGWLEQGGKFQGAATNVEYTVTLSKSYDSTEYYVSVNQVTKGSGTNTVYDSQYVVNKTTGSFGVVQGQSELPYYNWKTEGMGA